MSGRVTERVERSDTRRPARLVAGLLLAMTFVVGGLAGMALEEALGIDWFEFLDEQPERADALRLTEGLGLDEAQQAEVNRILHQQEEQLEEYWSARLPEMEVLAEQAFDRIRAVLTPEQRTIFDSRVEARGEPLAPAS